MIAAGLLTEYVTFEKSTVVQSASGAQTTTWVDVYTCKAYIPRLTSKASEVNSENTFTASLTMTVRKVTDIERSWRFKYNDDRYLISDIRHNRKDRTFTIIGIRINE